MVAAVLVTFNSMLLLLPVLGLISKFKEDNALSDELESIKGFAIIECWLDMELFAIVVLLAIWPEENQFRLLCVFVGKLVPKEI